MSNTIASKIKELRMRHGLSQEELSEESGLSLRTVQRIENGETEPRGDSLKKLAKSFGLVPHELMDWTLRQDRGYVMALNISALGTVVFPLLGILIPLVMWIAKKDSIKHVNQVGKEVINFQITWSLLYYAAIFYILIDMTLGFDALERGGLITPEAVRSRLWQVTHLKLLGLMFVLMFIYNITLVIVNTVRINRGKTVQYFPQIQFLRKY